MCACRVHAGESRERWAWVICFFSPIKLISPPLHELTLNIQTGWNVILFQSINILAKMTGASSCALLSWVRDKFGLVLQTKYLINYMDHNKAMTAFIIFLFKSTICMEKKVNAVHFCSFKRLVRPHVSSVTPNHTIVYQ